MASTGHTGWCRSPGRDNVSEDKDRMAERANVLKYLRTLPNSETRVVKPPANQRKPVPNIELSKRLKMLRIEEESIEEKKERIRKELKKCESPFIWKPTQGKPVDDPRSNLSRLEEKSEEIKDDKKFKFRHFIYHLVMGYELYRSGQVTRALEEVEGLQSTLVRLHGCREWLFLGLQQPLWHILYTSKAFLYLHMGLVKEAEQMLQRVQPVSHMKRSGQAGVHGVRAAVFMEFGHQGNVRALTETLRAVQLDEGTAEWHFLLAKCLGRIRHVVKCHEPVDPQELKATNRAVALEKNNPLYLVHLGQALSEQAFRMWKQENPRPHTERYKKMTNLYVAAKHKYFTAQTLRPDCPHVLMRCAKGLMKLPHHMVDPSQLRTLIQRAEELAPNNMMVHHEKAMFLDRYTKEKEKALEAFAQAAALGNYGAAMDLLRARFNLHQHTDYLQELDKMAERFPETNRLQNTLAQAGSYLLFIKDDLLGAVRYYDRVVDLNANSYALKSHRPKFLWVKQPINMFHMLIEEIESKSHSYSSKDYEFLKKFKDKICDHDCQDRCHTRAQQIVEMSREFKEIEREKEKRREEKANRGPGPAKRRRGRGRGRGGPGHGGNVVPTYHKGTENNSFHKDNFRGRGRNVRLGNDLKRERARSNSSFGSDHNITRRASIESLSDSLKSINLDDDVFSGRKGANMAQKYSIGNRSRGSSVCGSEGNTRPFGSGLHNSRISQNQSGGSSLTEENLKKFNQNLSDLPRSLSTMSICSSTSTSKVLSKMERVNQSYAMLFNRRQSMQGNQERKVVYKSESLHVLNKQHRSQNQNMFSDRSLPKSGSTQSLNLPPPQPAMDKFTFKPAFRSRESSVGSSHSDTFMPTFAIKPDEEK